MATVAAMCACLLSLIVGAWLVLQLSGAGDEFKTAVRGGFAAGGADTVATLQRLYFPMMLGVQGCAAMVSGACVRLIAGRGALGAAVVAITPLYVLAFSTGPTAANALWAGGYVAASIIAASLVGRRR